MNNINFQTPHIEFLEEQWIAGCIDKETQIRKLGLRSEGEAVRGLKVSAVLRSSKDLN